MVIFLNLFITFLTEICQEMISCSLLSDIRRVQALVCTSHKGYKHLKYKTVRNNQERSVYFNCSKTDTKMSIHIIT